MKALLASAAIATLMLAAPVAFAQQGDGSTASQNDQVTTQAPDNGMAPEQSGGTYGQMMRDNRKDAGIGPSASNGNASSTEMATRDGNSDEATARNKTTPPPSDVSPSEQNPGAATAENEGPSGQNRAMAKNQQSDLTTAQNGVAPSASAPPDDRNSDQATTENGAPSESK